MTTTTFPAAPAARPTIVRWLAAMIEQARVRHMNNPEFAAQIAAYPASRSAAVVVLPTTPR